jgi:excisionase family DNA binding protein
MSKHARAIAFPATSTPTTDEDLLDMKEAAKRLGLRPDTLKKMAQRKQIPSIKYGKLRRFEPAAIRAHIAKHRVG